MSSPPALERQADLASLVASRICHDLISPIGAIGNGVELLMLEQAEGLLRIGSGGEEIALIAHSAALASSRARFLRIAFGHADHLQSIAPSEMAALFTELNQDGRLLWQWEITQPMTRLETKCLCLGLLCLEPLLPYGGSITIRNEPNACGVVEARSNRIKEAPELLAHLGLSNAEPAPLAPSSVQFALLAQLSPSPPQLQQFAEGLRLIL